MNFLAHIFLSGDNDMLMLGNFMADHVKGKAIDKLDPELKKGVLLHRKIDFFTDNHPVVDQSKKRLRSTFNKFAPVVADVYYDHFLAAGWKKYSEIPLQTFVDNFYSIANKHKYILPERTQKMLPYMISNNWLVSYATVEGIGNVLAGMARRTKFVSGMENAAVELEKNYSQYQNEFERFFPELWDFTTEEILRNRP